MLLLSPRTFFASAASHELLAGVYDIQIEAFEIRDIAADECQIVFLCCCADEVVRHFDLAGSVVGYGLVDDLYSTSK